MTAAILVPDVQTRALIAAVRSLGRAGYQVHAASAQPQALGLKSRYADRAVLHPAYEAPEFLPWLRRYIADHHIRMIVPSSGLLFAIRPAFDEFAPLLPVSRDPELLYRCFDKTEVVRVFQSAPDDAAMMNHHPNSAIIELSGEMYSGLLPESDTGFFIKAESSREVNARLEDSGGDGFAFTRTSEEAVTALQNMSRGWRKALVQQACSGRQVCVSVLMHKGRALAVSAVRDSHARPHSKGTMSLRESGHFPEIEADAVRRLAHLGWEGCAMGEYRLDENTGAFNLIEINFRFWQYLHLDIWANMDYPRMQAEWFLDGRTDFNSDQVAGIMCRDTWPGEVAQLVSEWRRDDLTAHGKVMAVGRFFSRGLNPRIHSDLSFPGDRMLYWHNFRDYLRLEARTLVAKVRS